MMNGAAGAKRRVPQELFPRECIVQREAAKPPRQILTFALKVFFQSHSISPGTISSRPVERGHQPPRAAGEASTACRVGRHANLSPSLPLDARLPTK